MESRAPSKRARNRSSLLRRSLSIWDRSVISRMMTRVDGSPFHMVLEAVTSIGMAVPSFRTIRVSYCFRSLLASNPLSESPDDAFRLVGVGQARDPCLEDFIDRVPGDFGCSPVGIDMNAFPGGNQNPVVRILGQGSEVLAALEQSLDDLQGSR